MFGVQIPKGGMSIRKVLFTGAALAVISVIVLCGYVLIAAEYDSKVLADSFEEYQNDDIVEAVVFLKDLSHETVMGTFAERYPEECELYAYVKESEDPLTSEDIDSDMLDAAISYKRQVYREAYTSWNQAFSDEYSDVIEILFQSEYSPMVLIRSTYGFLNELKQDVMVEDVTICPDECFFNESLAIANTMTRADYVRDTCGNRGNNVIIGMVESRTKPKITDPCLTGAAITLCPTIPYGTLQDNHSTAVARILVGTSANTADDGFAPDAVLLSCSVDGKPSLFGAIEWLISNDVCIINASIDMGEEGVYGSVCKWIDHLAITHDVHFVTSSGNKKSGSYDVTAPGLAYNAITVGGYDPGSETQWNWQGTTGQ